MICKNAAAAGKNPDKIVSGIFPAAVFISRRKCMEEYLKVGVITSTHGLRGEVKVFPTTDDPERFRDIRTV